MPDDLPSQDVAWRFSMAYDGAALAVNDIAAAEMRVSCSDRTDDLSNFTGFWYELRDANDAVLYRRVTTNRMSQFIEIPSDTGDFNRIRLDGSAGGFEILVPALPDARTLVIFGPNPPDDEQGSAAIALATIEL